jgi:ferredoxin-NADP reductase
MEKHFVKILSIDHVTHDTLRVVTEKPGGYQYVPGQATDMAINKNGWQNEKRPFTFTSLPDEDHLEFIIKTYPEHDGATDKLLDMEAGDELILHEVFGSIRYKGEGTFIAGGAGVTPFLCMLRQLHRDGKVGGNRMIFANKTTADIILKEELEHYLGDRLVHILSEEQKTGYAHGLITEDFLRKHLGREDGFVYLCGPMPMMEAIEKQLEALGVPKKRIVKEGW